jgi:hypothetical protein
MPIFGTPNVDKMRDTADVKGLIKALTYQPDKIIRQRAA